MSVPISSRYLTFSGDPRNVYILRGVGVPRSVNANSLFTSRMSAESFVESVGIPKDKLFSKAKAAAIGRPTADKLTEMEIGVDIIPANATFSELMEAIKEYFSKE